MSKNEKQDLRYLTNLPTVHSLAKYYPVARRSPEFGALDQSPPNFLRAQSPIRNRIQFCWSSRILDG
jgi:hypothetical protein